VTRNRVISDRKKMEGNLANLSDEELVDLVRRDRPEAYQVLVDRYEALVKSVVAKFLARDRMGMEDACQETFLKALARIGDLRKPSRFKSWLCAIAHNQALDTIRRRKLVVNWDSTGGEENQPSWEIIDLKSDPSEAHDRNEVAVLMRDILSEMPDLYRDPIKLRYDEDLDYSQIAVILGKPLGTIKSLIHRGKAKIREELDRRAGGPDGALALAG
jgi:RNA polymerase sigma-70 factor (ECF subfamily)